MEGKNLAPLDVEGGEKHKTNEERKEKSKDNCQCSRRRHAVSLAMVVAGDDAWFKSGRQVKR